MLRLSAAVAAVAALTFVPPSLCAQGEALYYKFDEAGGSRVVNYAAASGIAPAEGTVVTTDVGGFAPGRFGAGALRGSGTGGATVYGYVDTGWPAVLPGDFTLAFFLKQRNPPTAASFLCGEPVAGGFRCFTGGAAGSGLRVSAAGTAPSDLDLTQDIRTPAMTRWVHVALVVDSSRTQATWWVDGVAQAPITLAAGASLVSTLPLRVGMQDATAAASTYDLDEFRLLTRAATRSEVTAWATRAAAADARFGTGCGVVLASVSSPPALGNGAYGLAVGGTRFDPFLLSVGSSRHSLFGAPLPLDLGLVFPTLPGCLWHSNLTLVFAGVTDQQGGALVPLPIPMDLSLDGASLYSQALLVPAGFEQSSNGFATSLGQ